MMTRWRVSCLLAILFLPFLSMTPAWALPILPGNEHSHGPLDVTWSEGGDPETHLHQHYNTLPLGVNNGANSWFVNKSWDNNGTTTTFHSIFDTHAFGHGFIANRVLFFFDPNFAAPNQAFRDRVVDGFNDWINGSRARFDAVGGKNVNDVPLRLGFNFVETTTRPTTEPYIDVEFRDLGAGTTGLFDSGTRELEFSTNAAINWYTGAANPTAGARQQDFLTTARHEIGHAVGFGHNSEDNKTADSSIMWGGAAPLDTRVSIKQADFDGVLADYTQPVPAPPSLILLLTGTGLLLVREAGRRLRQARPLWL
jgi:hypothetical protein